MKNSLFFMIHYWHKEIHKKLHSKISNKIISYPRTTVQTIITISGTITIHMRQTNLHFNSIISTLKLEIFYSNFYIKSILKLFEIMVKGLLKTQKYKL